MFRLPETRPRAQARFASWLLVGYLLVVAVATAAPWVSPQPYGPMCSASKVAGGGQVGGDPAGGALDCALCMPLQASTPPAHAHATLPQGPKAWLARPSSELPALSLAALPPARGPPSV